MIVCVRVSLEATGGGRTESGRGAPARPERPRPKAAPPDDDGAAPARGRGRMADGFVEAAASPAPVRAVAAARGFSAGNGFLAGLIVDRLV